MSVKQIRPSKKSGCFDEASPNRSVRDFLSMHIATFVAGTNKLYGKCSKKDKFENCELHIEHANGEDVSAADFKFKVTSGQVIQSSIECNSTP